MSVSQHIGIDRVHAVFGNQQIEWDGAYTLAHAAGLLAQAATIEGVIAKKKNQAPPPEASPSISSTASANLTGYLLKLGLNAPLVKTLTTGTKLVVQCVSAVLTYYDKKGVVNFSDPTGKKMVLDEIAQQGLRTVLDEKLNEHIFQIGVNSYDFATSFVDFTGLSGLPSAAVNLLKDIYYDFGARQMVGQINECLKAKDKFDVHLFTRMPLLGCYLLDQFDSGQLKGIFDAIDCPEELSAQERDQILGRLASSDQVLMAKYAKNLEPLKKLAQGHIRTAPYCLPDEMKRRKHVGVSGQGVDNLPGFLQPKSKAPAKNN